VREDPEYVRHGVANLFLLCEPLRGWREVIGSERRTRLDWAACIKELTDTHYPTAEKIILVMDNLNIHSPASLYEAFPPAEAKRLADRLEIHHTPKHGSWLNMAEIELGILQRQCLDRRLGDQATLASEVASWSPRAMPPHAASTGASPPPTRASNSSVSTQRMTTDTALGQRWHRSHKEPNASERNPYPARPGEGVEGTVMLNSNSPTRASCSKSSAW